MGIYMNCCENSQKFNTVIVKPGFLYMHCLFYYKQLELHMVQELGHSEFFHL